MEEFTSFRALTKKEVVNCTTGERLGYICDAEIDLNCGEIKYFITPAPQEHFSFKTGEGRKFAFSDITKIGCDIILISRAYPCSLKSQKMKKVL